MLLEKEGHIIHPFANGEEALTYIQDHPDEIDAVFLDEHMPKMMGSEVAQTMLSDDKLKTIPIILQTGVDDAEIDPELLTKVHKLQKPYMPNDVMDILNEKHHPLNFYTKTDKYVIYADDDPTTMKMMVRIMEKAGYHIKTFENGGDAWEHIQTNKDKIGAVLLDEHMPKMKGSQIAENMLADEQMRHIPVAIQSTSEKEEFDGELLCKVNRLQKPYIPEDITKIVKEMME